MEISKKPKIWQKPANFSLLEKPWGNRIPQTSINRAFQKPRVEMMLARLRALTPTTTRFLCFVLFVEMMLARLRALTHLIWLQKIRNEIRRNDGSPFKGIDTFLYKPWHNRPSLVEMMVAR